MYLICAGLSFLVTSLSIYFGNGYLPPELGKLSRVFLIPGVVQRASWVLLRLVHSIQLLVIIIVFISVMTPPKCLAKDTNIKYLNFEAFAILGVWIVQHIGGTIVRSVIDIDMSIH